MGAADRDHRKVWSRGFHDGVAYILREKPLNFERAQSLIQGLNGVCTKVYEAVPIQEAWSAQQVCTELYRKGSRIGVQDVDGCLYSLLRQKLVRKIGQNQFQKIVFEKPALMEPPVPTTPTPAPTPAEAGATKSPIDLLEPLAAEAVRLAQELRDLANKIEAAAVGVADMLAESNQKSEQLRQLKTLLNSIRD